MEIFGPRCVTEKLTNHTILFWKNILGQGNSPRFSKPGNYSFVFIGTYHWAISCASSIQSVSPHPIFVMSTLMLWIFLPHYHHPDYSQSGDRATVELVRKSSWLNLGTVPLFTWGNGGTQYKISVSASSVPTKIRA
jgi:hypothetical protein